MVPKLSLVRSCNRRTYLRVRLRKNRPEQKVFQKRRQKTTSKGQINCAFVCFTFESTAFQYFQQSSPQIPSTPSRTRILCNGICLCTFSSLFNSSFRVNLRISASWKVCLTPTAIRHVSVVCKLVSTRSDGTERQNKSASMFYAQTNCAVWSPQPLQSEVFTSLSVVINIRKLLSKMITKTCRLFPPEKWSLNCEMKDNALKL